MSRDNHGANFRLLGSPINLTYRGKKKEDKKNTRNRPRSALQNTAYKPDYHERYKRPYSADPNLKCSGKNLQKSFSIEVIQCGSQPIKVVPPTTELLGYSKSYNCDRNRDLYRDCGSDYGSEDTFVSLGTKIKARAQSGPKTKTSKNLLKYRNIAKKEKDKIKDTNNTLSDYNLEVKITEKAQGDIGVHEMNEFNFDPFDDIKFESSVYDPEPYGHYKCTGEEKGNFRSSSELVTEIKKAEDYYSRQLSLVEEESTQDFSSISPQNSLEHTTNQGTPVLNVAEKNQDKNNYLKDDGKPEEFKKMTQNFVNENVEERNYRSFYDDLQINSIEPYRSRLSSTIGITDESCKDSGYTDSGSNEEKPFRKTLSSSTIKSLSKALDTTSFPQPKSLDSYSTLKKLTNDFKKNEWTEPINHSRLLYKDFFIRKEDNGPKVPENSPNKIEENKVEEVGDKAEYPSYLLNSTTKAYTSKVIEDYKKELAAINNLHALTMKDIKIDAISPTPLNINDMFEQNAGEFLKDNRPVSRESSSSGKLSKSEPYEGKANKTEQDVSKISTKELIQNYLKVKDNDYSKCITKNLKRFDRKYPNTDKKLNNKTSSSVFKSDISMNVKNNLPSKPPLSDRMESIQNDKDIDSWMSLTCSKNSDEVKDNFKLKLNSLDHHEDDVNELGKTKDTEFNTNDKTAEFANLNGIEFSKGDGVPLESTTANGVVKELTNNASVLDIYSMLKEIESFGDNPVNIEPEPKPEVDKKNEEINQKDNFMEIFDFLERVEQSANEALSVVTSTTPQTIPKLEYLLKLPQTELAQRLVTLSLQLEERSCCIALLQESLTNHKQQMVSKVGALEKQSNRNLTKVKQECDIAIKRHQSFIDQLINDKKTLNHRIEQLVDERRSLEERWKRQAQALEDRYKLELKNQHDKMNAAQQVARQRWVRQKAEKIKELTVKGLEGELRDMADRQQKEVSDLKMYHAEQIGRVQAKHATEMEEMRQRYDDEKEAMLLKERQMASARMEKQILELEITYQEQRTRLIAEMRAENERVASGLSEKERHTRQEIEKWRTEQEEMILQKKYKLEQEIAREKGNMEEEIRKKRLEIEEELERYKRQYESEQQVLLKKKEKEISAQCKQERDREIERAIESMETEAQVGRKELQDALRRNKEQYESELKELAETEQATLKRYQDAQARIRLTENKCAELEVNISQLDTRNRLLAEKNTQLEERANEIRASCEQSWRSKLDDLKKEIDDKAKVHEEQMHQLYAKVKIAVARKDSAIQALTREASKAQEKVTLLEQKLQVQRKDFLKHK